MDALQESVEGDLPDGNSGLHPGGWHGGMDLLSEIGLARPHLDDLLRIGLRLLSAAAVGALIGYERERMGKAAGLRTHMLVAMGTTLFVVAAIEADMAEDAVSRVLQGIITGIGFLGAGTILKIHEDRQIRGLTTAAGIWMTAATSVAIGLGHIAAGVLAALLAWVVLGVLQRFEPDRR